MDLVNKPQNVRQNARGATDTHACGIGAHAVLLGKFQVTSNAVEEKRIEQRAIFGRKLRIDSLEGLTVIGPEIRNERMPHNMTMM